MCPEGPESYQGMISCYLYLSDPSRLPVCNAVWRIAFRDLYSHKLSEKRQPLGVGARWQTYLTATWLVQASMQ